MYRKAGGKGSWQYFTKLDFKEKTDVSEEEQDDMILNFENPNGMNKMLPFIKQNSKPVTEEEESNQEEKYNPAKEEEEKLW